ncbi:MAG: AzlC family ABC transporter permease [Stomatobaculum sp.]|nr:AzlC family ABC transporter permease [Stomatobaculum sp.]
MNTENRSEFLRGMRHGWPIGVGYFGVAFALGIAARNAGFSALQAGVMSAVCTASAGEFAGVTVAAASGTFLEMALIELVVNARYLLMSCALTQKLSPKLRTLHRMILANFVTDEIFGLSVSVPGTLNPFYSYGIISVSWPGWIAGTVLGVIMGNVLPANVVSALSVGLYGMFLAIIIPPTRTNHVLAGLVPVSMAISWIFTKLNDAGILPLSSGNRIILLTVAISLAAAALFPHDDPEDPAAGDAGKEAA